MMAGIRSFAMLAVVSAVAGGQNRRPPTPPTPPAPPPAPAAPLVPVPVSPRALRIEPGMAIDLDRIREQGEELRRQALDNVRIIDREAIEEARIQGQQAMIMSQDAMRSLAPIAAMPGMNGVYRVGPQGLDAMAPGPRYQADPADSLWRAAYNLLNSGDQRAAAQRFKELQQKYPNSQYFPRAMYYQAFSLYRSGTENELREALSVLESYKQKYPNARVSGENGYPADADNLMQRIRGNLAERGDANARRQLDQATGSSVACDRENIQVQAEALSALMRIDPAAATPKLEQILARREECTLNLRQNALQILTRRGDDKAVAILLATAKSDPSTEMRRNAVSYIAKFPNDEVLSTLESIAKNEQNDQIRRTAAASLVGYPSPRARQIVRTIVEDTGLTEDMRCDVLSRFNNERGSADDATWLRAAYPKMTSPRLKSCVIGAVSRIGGADSQKWLMDISLDENETGSVRSTAFNRSSTNMSVAELGRLYDNAGNRPMRTQVVRLLNQRKEPEALDKLIDILKKSTDLEIRLQIINLLSDRQNDPKAKQALIDAIGK